MHYDLTLNNLKIPNITGTFPFGTKVTPSDLNKGGLSTTEVNTNMMMPFANMRPKVVDQDGDTTTVDYDAKLVFSARSGTTPSAGYSVVMGQGAYVGCTVTFTNLMSYSCKVYQYDGTTTLFDIPSGNTFQAVWNGSVWVWTTSNAITANDPRPASSAAVHDAIGGVNLWKYVNTWTTNIQRSVVYGTSYSWAQIAKALVIIYAMCDHYGSRLTVSVNGARRQEAIMYANDERTGGTRPNQAHSFAIPIFVNAGDSIELSTDDTGSGWYISNITVNAKP